jgi:hypothetical protein
MIKEIWRRPRLRVLLLSQVFRVRMTLIVVEEYIKDLDDGDMLMDMMSANASFDRTTLKRGENIYPEVPSSQEPINPSISLQLESKPVYNLNLFIPASSQSPPIIF